MYEKSKRKQHPSQELYGGPALRDVIYNVLYFMFTCLQCLQRVNRTNKYNTFSCKLDL